MGVLSKASQIQKCLISIINMYFNLFPVIAIIVGIFGLIVGSFLNVIILRQGKSGIGGRSHCPHCEKQLSWYELIPVFSFLLQRGKCRSCKQPISLQYPLVELLTGVIFYFSAIFLLNNVVTPVHLAWSVVGALLFLDIVSLGIMITVYDIRTKQVPVLWMLGLLISGTAFLAIQYATSGIGFSAQTILPHLFGLIVAVPFLFLWIISQGKWMGFADIEIIAWIGWFFGVVMGASAVLSAFYLGALFAIVFIILKRIRGVSYASIRTTQIPFAPFLIFGWFVTAVFSWDIFSLFGRLFM